MTIDQFKKMQKSYIDEFTHEGCNETHSYIEWNEIFEEWVDELKVNDDDSAIN